MQMKCTWGSMALAFALAGTAFGGEVITPNDFTGTDSERIEKAIAEAVRTKKFRMTIPSVNAARGTHEWIIDRAIIIPSDFTILLDDAWVELAPGVRDNIIRNAAAGKKGAKPDKNIEVLGVHSRKSVLCGGRKCHYDPPGGDNGGWRTVGILLQNVDGFIVSNLEMNETQSWAISMENGCRNGRVSNIRFSNSNSIKNQDGVDIRKGCHDITVENIFGYCGDDVVALTGLMCAPGAKPRKQMQIGGDEPTGDDDIYNITVRNVYAKCVGGHGIIRLLNHDGVKIHHVTVSNVWNTAAPDDKPVYSCVRVGDQNFSTVRKSRPEEMHDIVISDIHWSGQSGVRYSGAYTNVTERNVKALADEAFPLPALVPAPRKVRKTGGVFFAPSAYVERGWIAFSRDASLPPEGYRLSVTPRGVSVAASDERGELHAMSTLRQLGGERTRYANCDPYDGGDRGAPLLVPCCEIEDSPAYRWRGMLIDEGRHFFGKETVKHVIDQMSEHKFNVLHWHLTEDQGWRIAIDKYPKLVEYGSVRPHSPVRFDYAGENNGEKYGPFYYTKDEIREIVAYAAARGVTIVPEVEFPGHIRAALAGYPEFSCTGASLPRVPRCTWGIEDDVLCVGNDAALKFVEDVLDEVVELFPGEFFHIGGDECPTKRWKECPKCIARAKELGLEGPEKLQGWVTKRFTEYLAKKGKRTIGWDEILECEIPVSSGVMSWRGCKGGIAGAKAGHDVVMCPQSHCYFNRMSGIAEDPFTPRNASQTVSLGKVYGFDPVEGIPADCRGHVLGSQACFWSEVIWNGYDLDWKMWPRACALAEVLWTAPAKRDFAEFSKRMREHRRRLISHGVNCAPLE